MTDEEVFSEFRGSVFRIETTNESGTGYLIDSNRGYVLTAFHVVKSAYQNASATINATSTSLPGVVLKLRIVNKLDGPQDIALLKVKDTSPLVTHHIRALDIAIHFPHGNRYFTIGYPRGKNTPNTQTAELQGRSDDNQFLDVKQDVDEGSSGSPLIDENGAVVATCVSYLNKSEANYTPMQYAEELLEGIPADARAEKLDTEVRHNTAGGAFLRSLVQELKWTSGNASNLELYEWASKMAKSASHDVIRPYLSCPLIPAYSDRRLSEANVVQRIAELGPSVFRAKVLLNAADQDLFLGRHVSARDEAQQARDLYRGMQDTSGEVQALTILGRANLYLHQFEEASKVFSLTAAQPNSPAEHARTSVYLAQAYAGLGDSKLATQYVEGALPELRSAGDTEGQALGLDTLGRVATTKGNYEVASNHFRTAMRLCAEKSDTVCEASENAELVRVNELQSHTLRARTRGFLEALRAILPGSHRK